MEINQPSKNASSKIKARVSQLWAENLITEIIDKFMHLPSKGKAESILNFVINELNRNGIYVIPHRKK